MLRSDKHSRFEPVSLSQSNISETNIHRIREIDRQVSFLCNFSKASELLRFELPEKLTVAPATITFDTYSSTADALGDLVSTYANFVNSITKEVDVQIKKHNTFKLRFYNAVFNSFFYEIVNYHKPILQIDKDLLICPPKNSSKLKFDICGFIKEFFKKIVTTAQETSNNQLSANKDWLESILKLLEYIDSKIQGTDFDYSNIQIPIVNSHKGIQFKELITYYQKVVRVIPFLTFDWRDLSSGEKAVLNTYSRFYASVKDINTINERFDSIVLLIDEGEIYLHPQWQKRMLNDLLRFLPQVYSRNNSKVTIQVILTANSPFVVSDLPNYNIIFMKKGSSGSFVVDGLSDKRQTFGSNIHTLFADSFFVTDGLIGDYANHKINNLIDELMNSMPEKIISNKDYIAKLINLIGEPVLKNRLQSLLNEKMQLDVINVNEKINYLQKQIDELRKVSKNDAHS